MTISLLSKRIVTGRGLFIITLTAPKEIEAGGTVRFSARFLHMKDGAVNPSSLTAKVYEGRQHAVLLASPTPIVDVNWGGSPGAWFAEWTVPSSQGSGPVVCVFSGTYQSTDAPGDGAMSVQGSIGTRVVNPWR